MGRWMLPAGLFLVFVCCLVSADVPNDDYCDAKPVGSSACAWREDCKEDGCPSCVLNRDRVNNLRVLEDRAFGEQYWELCPQLATLVNLTLPGPKRPLTSPSTTATSASTGRRLLQDGTLDALTAAGLFLEGTQGSSQRSFSIRSLGRSLMQAATASTSLASTGTETIPAEYTLDCPTNVTVSGGENLLVRFGQTIQSVFQSFADGEDLTEEQSSKFKFVLDQPNRWLTLMQYLLDPPSITAYMEQNCGNHVVGEGSVNERVTAARWVRQDVSSLTATQPLRLCTDKGATAWKDFHLGFMRIGARCSPPFGSDACYPKNTWLYVTDSSHCATEYASMFSAQHNTLQDLSALNVELHQDCSSITEKEQCEAATDSADVLAARADLAHAKLPYTAAANSQLAAAVAARFVENAEAALERAEAGIEGEGPLDYELDGPGDGSASDSSGQDEAEAEGDAADGGSQPNHTLIIVPIVVATCLLCAACAAAVYWRKDRASKSTPKSKLPDGSESFAANVSGGGKSNGDEHEDKGEKASHSIALSIDEDSKSWSNPTFADAKKASASSEEAQAGATSSSESPKVAPPELQVDANATVMHVPHASHAPTEVNPVLSAPDWQAASQLSQMSQVPMLPNGAPDYSMFARSAMEPAESSMAGGASALPSAPASEQGAGDVEFVSLPSEHGAVDSEMPSMHGDYDSDSAELAPLPPSRGRLEPMHSPSRMHDGASPTGGASRHLNGEDSLMLACPAALGGIQGGPSALASMLGASASLMGASSALSSMHGGASGSVSRMGGDDSMMMPCPGRAPRTTASSPWSGDTTANVCQALDMMWQMQEPFANRYNLLGSSERAVGGSGVLQAATDTTSGAAVILKIFTKEACFDAEMLMYSTAPVAEAAGTTHAYEDNSDRSATCQFTGFVFPPYSVSLRTESLEGWLQQRGAPEVASAVQVLGLLIKGVKALHGAGYAHRNIKPSNILQRSSCQHDWALSDLASCRPLGAHAQLSESPTSVPYTAPEIITSASPASPGVPVSTTTTAEADIWALGVVMFEILTNERVFPPGTTPQAITAALSGEAPLPWERDASADGARLWEEAEKVPALKVFVLACLNRDPAERPPAAALEEAWALITEDMACSSQDGKSSSVWNSITCSEGIAS